MTLLQVSECLQSFFFRHKPSTRRNFLSLFLDSLPDGSIFSLLVVIVDVSGHFAIVFVITREFFLILLVDHFLTSLDCQGVIMDHLMHIVFNEVSVNTLIQLIALMSFGNRSLWCSSRGRFLRHYPLLFLRNFSDFVRLPNCFRSLWVLLLLVSIWHLFNGLRSVSPRWWLKLLFLTKSEIFHWTLVLANFVFDMNAS